MIIQWPFNINNYACIDTACGVSCDGTKDCDNGEDEQDNCTCDDPALPFKCTSGGIYWDH